jgi:hypothetical protein
MQGCLHAGPHLARRQAARAVRLLDRGVEQRVRTQVAANQGKAKVSLKPWQVGRWPPHETAPVHTAADFEAARATGGSGCVCEDQYPEQPLPLPFWPDSSVL